MRKMSFVIVAASMMVSSLGFATELRFDCTPLGLPDPSRVAEIAVVVSTDAVDTKSPIHVTGFIDHMTLSKTRFMQPAVPVHKENDIKVGGDYSLAPRQRYIEKKVARDMNLTPVAGQTTRVKRLYISTMPQKSFVELTDGETFGTDCALDPM